MSRRWLAQPSVLLVGVQVTSMPQNWRALLSTLKFSYAFVGCHFEVFPAEAGWNLQAYQELTWPLLWWICAKTTAARIWS